MKSGDRVIRKGDYYYLQTLQDLMQQKSIKKQQVESSTNIPIPNQNIITQLPLRSHAINSYKAMTSTVLKTGSYGLDQYENSLEQLLKLPIKDEERLEAEKLLKEIASIRNNGQLPLNQVNIQNTNKSETIAPKTITLTAQFNVQNLQKQIQSLQQIKYIELSRLQNIVQILMGQSKVQTQQQPPAQMDAKTKDQIQSIYNSINTLKCVNNLPGIISQISSNQHKYTEMLEWAQNIQKTNQKNQDILDAVLQHEVVLKQLQASFKANIQRVRQVIKKLQK